MIKGLIRFSANNRFIVLLATAVVVGYGVYVLTNIPVDAIPDLSDTQVIIYSRWDRSPDIIEDQVTYPIISSLLGAPKVKAIRGFSDFGFSYVYVIFEDGTDMYWARTRVLEYLSKITPQLPADVKTELGPDASSVGWVFQYALVDRSGRHSSDELRSFQDWNLRYAIQSVPGVSEVATVGGQVRQYQVTVNPNALAAFKLPLDAVIQAVRSGNNDVGGRLVEFAGAEYMVRGRGYARSVRDIEEIAVGADARYALPDKGGSIGKETTENAPVVALVFGQSGLIAGATLSGVKYTRIIPESQAAEFFGFYNMLGKFAAVMGPFLMGWISVASGNPRYSIFAVSLLFICGAGILYFVDETEGSHLAEELEAS